MTADNARTTEPRLTQLPEALAQIRELESLDEATGLTRERSQWSGQVWPPEGPCKIPGRGLDKELRSMLRRPSEVARLNAIVGMTRDDDVVLDIGCGPGLVGVTIALNRRVNSYTGFDLNAGRVAAAERLAQTNNVSGRLHFAVGDVTEMGALRTIDGTQPTIITLFEVLEHLADPTKILSLVAALCDDTTSVAFSVPLLGRIEHCWGHRSLFGVDVVIAMCQRAGLELTGALPVYNQWMICTARARPETASVIPSDAGAVPRVVRHPPLRKIPVQPGLTFSPGPPARLDICVDSNQSITIPIEMPAMTLARFELGFEARHSPEHLSVVAVDEAGTTVARLDIEPEDVDGDRNTFVFRPGLRLGASAEKSQRRADEPSTIIATLLTVTAGDNQVRGRLWRVGFASGAASTPLVGSPASAGLSFAGRSLDDVRVSLRLGSAVCRAALSAFLERCRKGMNQS